MNKPINKSKAGKGKSSSPKKEKTAAKKSAPKIQRRWSYDKQEHQVRKGNLWVKDESRTEKEWQDAQEFVEKWVSEYEAHQEDQSGSIMNIAMRYRLKCTKITRYRNALNKAFREAGLVGKDELVLKDIPELTARQKKQLQDERTSPSATNLHELLKIAKYKTS